MSQLSKAWTDLVVAFAVFPNYEAANLLVKASRSRLVQGLCWCLGSFTCCTVSCGIWNREWLCWRFKAFGLLARSWRPSRWHSVTVRYL